MLIIFLCCLVNPLFAQHRLPQLSLQNNSKQLLEKIGQDSSIDADSAYKILNHWSQYPEGVKTGHEYVYFYTDPVFGQIPLRIYIPASYKSSQKSPCVLVMHGAAGRSFFTDIDSLDRSDVDGLFPKLKKQDPIIVEPVADRDKKFSWVVNQFGGRNGDAPNPTFATLVNIIISLKKILNIDDNRVFAWGHSDGSDGAVGLAVYSPDMFAGFVAYNSLLNNIYARDFYIRNIQNRPVYIVHSDLDDIRPIQQARVIIDALKKFDNTLQYKEYIGYQHEDKHLEKDADFSISFIKGLSRNPFKANIYWETDKTDLYNTCDWLRVTGIDTTLKKADWHTSFNFDSYNKRTKEWMKQFPYYYHLNNSSAVKAHYAGNVFSIETSEVTEIELLISPTMVDLTKPVTVNVNGKQVYFGKIPADKVFVLKEFDKNFDRQALWVNSVKIKTN